MTCSPVGGKVYFRFASNFPRRRGPCVFLPWSRTRTVPSDGTPDETGSVWMTTAQGTRCKYGPLFSRLSGDGSEERQKPYFTNYELLICLQNEREDLDSRKGGRILRPSGWGRTDRVKKGLRSASRSSRTKSSS